MAKGGDTSSEIMLVPSMEVHVDMHNGKAYDMNVSLSTTITWGFIRNQSQNKLFSLHEVSRYLMKKRI